ncbi:MAG: Coq4 family protein [Acidimicrobiales bacterium]
MRTCAVERWGNVMTEADLDEDGFVALVAGGGGEEAALAATSDLHSKDPSAPFRIAALCLNAAIVQPELLVPVYDGLTAGWSGEAPRAVPMMDGDGRDEIEPATVGDDVWAALWVLVHDPDAGRDPADITVRTAAIAGLLPDALNRRVASTALCYPGVEAAARSGLPPRFTLAQLAACPTDSLGGHLHALVVDNGFDLEVLDRDALGLAELPPPLDYLNVRILQCHDIWHAVAGYETTGLHEVAISGFQMGQFGHLYSSIFLGVVLTKVAFTQPFEGFGFLLDTILSAYRHGRESPPLLGVDWESIWDRPVDAIRVELGIRTYESPYPPGLLEDLRSA